MGLHEQPARRGRLANLRKAEKIGHMVRTSSLEEHGLGLGFRV